MLSNGVMLQTLTHQSIAESSQQQQHGLQQHCREQYVKNVAVATRNV